MKWSILDIIGKEISQVVVVEREAYPDQQMFLIFSDGTSMEFYGEPFKCASNLETGGLVSILEFLGRMKTKTVTVYP